MNIPSKTCTDSLFLNQVIQDNDDCTKCSLFKYLENHEESLNKNHLLSSSMEHKYIAPSLVVLSFQLLMIQLRNYIVLKKISSITHLHLEKNDISLIEDGIRKLPNNCPLLSLQYLNMNHNKLKSLNIFNLIRLFPNLEFIMMRNNLISQLNSHSIPIYGNVKVLDLSENKIKKLDGLSSLKYSLQILNIQKNEIETLNDMSQVLELEQLTNIDFRGNPIQSLEEENLIFEEILEKCNNVWFINGATTLASPLVEEDENHHFEKNEYSIMMEFEENSNSFKNQSCCGHVSSLTPMHVHDFEENRELQSISSSSIPPPPRKSQQHQQQHTLDHSTTSSHNNLEFYNDEKKRMAAEELLKRHSYISEQLNGVGGVVSSKSRSRASSITPLLNDSVIMKNLSNFAKVRNKRSDSCPSIPSPPLQKVRGIPKENMNHNSVSDRVSITTTTTTTSSSDENDQGMNTIQSTNLNIESSNLLQQVSTTQRQDHLPGQQTPETSSPSILTRSPFEQVLKQESTTTHTIEGGTLAATHSNRKDEPHSKEGKTIVEPNTCQEKSNNHRSLSIKERAKQNMLKRLNM